MAVAYCHANQVSHRDLKPENILIEFKTNDISLKVIDFGTSHHYEKGNHQMTQLYGTPYYIAPEVLFGDYNEKCDVWSIGVILYILLSGMPPFGGSDEEILKKVKNFNGTWEFAEEKWKNISEEAKSFLKKLLNRDPIERITAQDALTDSWITQKVKRRPTDQRLVQDALGNLAQFKNDSKLKQATLTFMATHLATKQQLTQLKTTFLEFDENGDGLIQRDEFIRGYRRLYPD
mmetsp:Transcript_16498/g.20892  ORF Transcript_16498/g.20892 Transcript_16498/m.20892 type:complete len:233 (-) Transcript_16498:827-1525(-)